MMEEKAEMTEAIIVAIITGVCAIVAQAIISSRSNRELYASEETCKKVESAVAVGCKN